MTDVREELRLALGRKIHWDIGHREGDETCEGCQSDADALMSLIDVYVAKARTAAVRGALVQAADEIGLNCSCSDRILARADALASPAQEVKP